MLSNVCGCSLRLVRIGLGIFYFILFFVCVLHGFVLGCCLGLSLLLLNFVIELVKFISDFRSIKFFMALSLLLLNFIIELVKFISDFRSIKFFMAFKKINNIVERSKCKFIETNC